ncbi:MAG: hypothetical protein PHF44_03235 [Candidatus Pacebacteria bacterium]|nr:hypothetical protein [Candidatus Paceibacterota bacterium]
MSDLSTQTQKLIHRYESWYNNNQAKGNLPTMHVDEIASRVAGFYEKIRTIVDWKEEHLMRRAAIIRKLKRRFLGWELNNSGKAEDVAEPLIMELIRGGHFPNDKIEESKIDEVQKIVNKYNFILQSNNEASAKTKRGRLHFYNWILEIAACEIEDILDPFTRGRALIDYMFEIMKARIMVAENALFDEDKNIQIYIAVQQALFKLDEPIITYHLLKYRILGWNDPSPALLLEITKNIFKIWDIIEKDLSNPLAKKFYAVCEKYDTPFLLLGDILSHGNPSETAKNISEPEVLEIQIKKTYNARLATLKKRLYRAALYSTLSILLTNIFSFFVLEIPLAKLITGNFTPITIIVDILGPTLLMFFLTITVQTPSKSNLDMVVLETMKIAYQKENTDTYLIKVTKKRGTALNAFINFIYLLGAVISFGLVYLIFKLAGFPRTSVVINILFVSLIMFAGLAIRKRARELSVEDEKRNLSGFVFDILSLPVAETGKWFSNKWRQYNAIAAFFNALIDMPFLIFVEFIERWRAFLKEKEEEIH